MWFWVDITDSAKSIRKLTRIVTYSGKALTLTPPFMTSTAVVVLISARFNEDTLAYEFASFGYCLGPSRRRSEDHFFGRWPCSSAQNREVKMGEAGVN